MTVIGPTELDASDVALIVRLTAFYDQSYPLDVLVPPADPTLTTLTPNSIVVNTETPCVVTGTGFTHNSHVYVDGVEQGTTYISPTSLRYTAEASSVGTQDVTIRTRGAANESAVVVMTVTATVGAEVATEQAPPPDEPAQPDTAPLTAPDEPPPEGGGVTGGRKPRNGKRTV